MRVFMVIWRKNLVAHSRYQVQSNYYYGAFGARESRVWRRSPLRKPLMINALATLALTEHPTVIPTYMDITDPQNPITVEYASLAAISTGADAADTHAKSATLQATTVALNDTTDLSAPYHHEMPWTETGKLNIDRQITPLQITARVVTLTFDDGGNISGVTSSYNGKRIYGNCCY